MARGYFEAKKDTCNYCGAYGNPYRFHKVVELRRVCPRTVICRKCAIRTKDLERWEKSPVVKYKQ